MIFFFFNVGKTKTKCLYGAGMVISLLSNWALHCKEEILRNNTRNRRFTKILFWWKVECLHSPQQFCFDRLVFIVFSWVNMWSVVLSEHIYRLKKKKKKMTDLWAKNWSVEVLSVWGTSDPPFLGISLVPFLWVLLRALERNFCQEWLWMVLLKVFVPMDWQSLAFLADYLHPY